MKVILVILGYLKWHYGKAILSLSSIWKNFLNFIYQYFSIRLLFRNFFDPWKRMSDTYPKHLDLQKYLFALITNIIVRIVGILLRTVLIIVGLTSYFLLIIFYPVVIITWLFLPLIVLSLIAGGIFLIIK